ncbi:hypothetical protein DL96DRAFT_1724001 [Flagelloscypha sp. PMI_526]|nr:hypothetical protein DL96DRAFT_1724001 [Flagelloscypha sp. PMI_526]
MISGSQIHFEITDSSGTTVTTSNITVIQQIQASPTCALPTPQSSSPPIQTATASPPAGPTSAPTVLISSQTSSTSYFSSDTTLGLPSITASSGKGKRDLGTVIGGIVGGVSVFLMTLAGAIVFLKKRGRHPNLADSQGSPGPNDDTDEGSKDPQSLLVQSIEMNPQNWIVRKQSDLERGFGTERSTGLQAAPSSIESNPDTSADHDIHTIHRPSKLGDGNSGVQMSADISGNDETRSEAGPTDVNLSPSQEISLSDLMKMLAERGIVVRTEADVPPAYHHVLANSDISS